MAIAQCKPETGLNREQRFTRFQDIGCLCCAMEGYLDVPVDVHHLVDRGDRAKSGGDAATLPICPWHHRGVPPSGFTEDTARGYAGPSLALQKKRWKERYGTEREVLELTNMLLVLPLFEIRRWVAMFAGHCASSATRLMQEVRA